MIPPVTVKKVLGWTLNQNQLRLIFDMADKAAVGHEQQKKQTRREIKEQHHLYAI